MSRAGGVFVSATKKGVHYQFVHLSIPLDYLPPSYRSGPVSAVEMARLLDQWHDSWARDVSGWTDSPPVAVRAR